MAKRKKQPPPKMDCVGYQEPYLYDVNEKTGVEYWAYPCEGCGDEKIIRKDRDVDPNSPLFFRNCKNQCTTIKAITDHHDDCKKCGGPIFLTPGAAMYKKRAGSGYVQRIEYCDDCLEEVVATRPCRNKACSDIGGEGIVEGTFRDQLFYEKMGLTFPPKNCEICRDAKKVFEQTATIKKICSLCQRNFYVSGKMMIMILKNEDTFQIPTECRRCANSPPEERKKLEQQRELEKEYKQRMIEVERILSGNNNSLSQEKVRLIKVKEAKKQELIELINSKNNFKIVPSPNKFPIPTLLKNVAGNESIPESYKQELPKAVAEIAKITPNALGLLRPASNWGPRATALQTTLKHKTRGAGFAYEVLGTAALISKWYKATDGIASLRIFPIDRIDFGIKLQASYFGTEKVLESQPKRGTVEADLFISRPRSIIEGGYREIGVDFKHSLYGETYGGTISDSQIKGIKIAILTGEIHEFHFVTNGAFSQKVLEKIETANEDLKKEGVRDGVIACHQYVKFGDM